MCHQNTRACALSHNKHIFNYVLSYCVTLCLLMCGLYNLLMYNYDIPGRFVTAQPFRHLAFSQPLAVVTLPINFLLSVADL